MSARVGARHQYRVMHKFPCNYWCTTGGGASRKWPTQITSSKDGVVLLEKEDMGGAKFLSRLLSPSSYEEVLHKFGHQARKGIPSV